MIRLGKFVCAVVTLATAVGCAKGDKPPLTREAFAAAVSKCQPLNAAFTTNRDAPPSVVITIPNGSSAVPDCMAKEFADFAITQLQINYARSGEASSR